MKKIVLFFACIFSFTIIAANGFHFKKYNRIIIEQYLSKRFHQKISGFKADTLFVTELWAGGAGFRRPEGPTIPNIKASDNSIVCCQECFLYTYTGVGLSALLVSDEQGNAKALTSGTSDRTGSTLSCIYTNHLLIMSTW